MEQVNMHYAKTNLSRLVEEAVNGKPFIIARDGKPLVSVQALPSAAQKPRYGFLKDQISIPDDFDRMGQTEIEKTFGLD